VARRLGIGLRLVVVHYHLRPGGIRRVIEQSLPWLVSEAPRRVHVVTLASGEAEDKLWNDAQRQRLAAVDVEFSVDPAIGYLAEQEGGKEVARRRIRQALGRLLRGADATNTLVWAHNLGIARNVLLTAELFAFCGARSIPIVAHHHDWWFDNRWQRWPDIRLAGLRNLKEVANVTFHTGNHVRHAAINRADAAILARGFGKAAGWLPNLSGSLRAPERGALRAARSWLDRQLGESNAPVWVLPCRLLRRKNVGEALLLTRWLRPEAWLVVTGAASSADEMPYSNQLTKMAALHHWRLRLGLLDSPDPNRPGIPELLGASEVVLLTSIQEGFGLPYLEATAARRPLIARSLPNIAPDLHRFGFRFPQYYDEIRIAPGLFDWHAEVTRQRRLYGDWRRRLPSGCRRMAGEPVLLRAGAIAQPVAFSRLTMAAQLEVLAQPLEKSWRACVPLNPFLESWRQRAQVSGLRCAAWPRTADRWLEGRAYARRFYKLALSTPGADNELVNPETVQNEFLRAKLGSDQLYPMLWALET
jgi:hypothetical protein